MSDARPSPERVDAELKERLVPMLRESLRDASGSLRAPYLVPGSYDQCWDWDSYFIAVALAGQPEAHEHIRGTVENFFACANDEGRIPRWFHPTASFWESTCSGADFRHDIAKPFLAQTALVHAEATGDFAWFKPLLEQQQCFLEMWTRERASELGLFAWANGLESGGDNHPNVYGWPAFSVEGVDLAVFMVREHLASARLALGCGAFSLGQHFLGTARYLAHQLVEHLHDPVANRFANRHRPSGRLIRIDVQTDFYPMWLGPWLTVGESRAKTILREGLLDPARFRSPHGIRSVSALDPIHNNLLGTGPSNWQGPIWINANYIHVQSLLACGLREEALQLAADVQWLLLRDLRARGKMSECYDSETGQPLAMEGFVGWNLLALGMLDEAKAGVGRTVPPPARSW